MSNPAAHFSVWSALIVSLCVTFSGVISSIDWAMSPEALSLESDGKDKETKR